MQKGKWWLALLIILVLSWGSGSVALAKTAQKLTRTCTSGHVVTLEFATDELKVYTPVNARLKVADAAGNPVSGALIYCSLYMPNLATGTNRPRIKAAATAGAYEGVMLFSQRGTWNAALTLNLPGGVYEELLFEINGVAAVQR